MLAWQLGAPISDDERRRMEMQRSMLKVWKPSVAAIVGVWLRSLRQALLCVHVQGCCDCGDVMRQGESDRATRVPLSQLWTVCISRRVVGVPASGGLGQVLRPCVQGEVEPTREGAGERRLGPALSHLL